MVKGKTSAAIGKEKKKKKTFYYISWLSVSILDVSEGFVVSCTAVCSAQLLLQWFSLSLSISLLD